MGGQVKALQYRTVHPVTPIWRRAGTRYMCECINTPFFSSKSQALRQRDGRRGTGWILPQSRGRTPPSPT